MPERIFGHIEGYPEGSIFESRQHLSQCGVHRPIQAGISGGAEEGADSIVLSGGYEDDKDYGDAIIYTGHGGQNPATRQHVSDQQLTRQNLALVLNKNLALPVRVIRGHTHNSEFSPSAGYRYDGLFYVDNHWIQQGQSGFKVVRFKLIKAGDPNQLTIDFPSVTDRTSDETGSRTPSRRETTILRVVRDTRQARIVKQLYDFRCQVCNIVLEGSAGPYAEAAHIKPLGSPHNGPDTMDNLICLCPNHHVLFDNYGFSVDENMNLIGIAGELDVHPRHTINSEYIQYHNNQYSYHNNQ